ncbi:centrosomal protein of 44 kDa [Notolabrus celidotus]|uniref:centrosomal protein of 44 kDa n=1 Tax=Notolabrus celidotus TaxID=1203425 RepID=UPI0014907AA9|nr:centrosomal protein of 44 kDa [Notolabrus celidotus]
MLSTGDVQGCLRKLETLLRAIKYPGNVDYNRLSKGDPSAVLPIVSFTLTSFSPPFAEQLMAAGLELMGKTDLRFTDTLYKVLRDIFHYKPVLTKQQFLQWGFSQRKISVVCDIINLVLQKHNQLKKPRVRCLAPIKELRGDVQPSLAETHTVSNRPVVMNHTENHSTFHLNSPHIETFSSSSARNGITEPVGDEEEEEEEEEEEDILHSSEVEGRLSALENQLQGLQSGLDRVRILEKSLEHLEKRLEGLERQRDTDKSEGDVVIVSRESWENLMSRVVLLETKAELRDTQLNTPPPCPSPSSSSAMSDASKEDLKERLERITNMLKSTSSLLQNAESPSTPSK